MKVRSVVWTWSNSADEYLKIADIGQALPAELFNKNEFTIKFKNAFEKGAAYFFEPLRLSQPATWNALMFQCGTPFVAQIKTHPTLNLAYTIANDLMVEIGGFDPGAHLRDWSGIFADLPEFMHGYYQNFNGMHASYENVISPFCSLNLPAKVGTWVRLSDFASDYKISKKRLLRIRTELGDPEYIDIIIWTEWDDLVLINHNTHDKKLYVIPEGRFENYFELQEPQKKIDELCSHVLTGSLEPYFLKP
ncbi:hypothetical protein ACO0K9_02260 [Undibacterium sp. Ji50W]|uniref:hypothetical protein n=1 Tax=Undibacterium sp. Ji50W TaxID=3413041 RepID=UPI003BF098FB